MPLLRLRDDYTAETFMQDFYDGNLGMGIWGGGNTDYNFVVSFQKMSPEDQQTVLGRIRRDPRALEILHRIEAQYDETIAYDDFLACGGESGAKEAGKMRVEGSEYLVKDGDVFHFRFNV